MKKQIALLTTSLLVTVALAVEYNCNTTVQYPCNDSSYVPHSSCPNNTNAGTFIGEGNQQDNCVYAFGSTGENGCKIKNPMGEWCTWITYGVDCAGNVSYILDDGELKFPTVPDGPC
jgi:hypothetical protein